MNKSLNGATMVLLQVQNLLEEDDAALKEQGKMAFFTKGGLIAIHNVVDEYQIILWKIESFIGVAVMGKAAGWEKKLDYELQKWFERMRKNGETPVPKLQVSGLTILGKVRWAMMEGELDEVRVGIDKFRTNGQSATLVNGSNH
jgi:hypothetical protein